MSEIAVNLHMHTRHSDGSGSHQDIADAALEAGVRPRCHLEDITRADIDGTYSGPTRSVRAADSMRLRVRYNRRSNMS